jgi:hypothetical protein
MKKSGIALKTNKIISLDKYAGKWVAFLGNRIIESSKSLEKLVKKVEKRKFEKKVSFFLVPKLGKNSYLVV